MREVRETDILIVIYPNLFTPERVIILDPYDNKIQQYNVNSLEEVKEVLKQNLPFCSQNHESTIHLGAAYILEWESLPQSELKIKKPEDVDIVIALRSSLLMLKDDPITVRCFSAYNQILCVDDFAKNVINLTTREYRRLTVCEYEKLLEELQEANAKELTVTEVEKHRYKPRTYYRIYYIDGNYCFMEIFDGVSATYEYSFCNSKEKCLQVMETREAGNEMMY